ncbi:hypothetical protein CSKR_111508 [Clonorchis sinensis]|uniref:Uncharacterized protein n=1 Tax=Clonorchis sinensis TaxID=79923 RepID=A0A3R7GJ30_CLOSI|nr:hypothetical protein CSKR_111508 [Clonorchis sinensis]
MRSRDDLLSTDNRTTPVRIRPPAGETTYPKHGSTVVRCTWEHTNTGDRFERDLTVRILPANLTGTLDRENTDDPVLDVGDNKQLECDLLPLGLAAELDGVWKATVNGAAADIVEIDHTANRAKIRPRNPPGYYTQETSFVVNCVLLASDDNETVILQFNRTVTVTRKRQFVSNPHTHNHTHTHTHTHTRTYPHTRTHAHAQTQARAHRLPVVFRVLPGSILLASPIRVFPTSSKAIILSCMPIYNSFECQSNHLNCHLCNFRCNSQREWSILQVSRLDAACDLLAPQRGMRTVADEIPMPFRRSDFEQARHLDTGRA